LPTASCFGYPLQINLQEANSNVSLDPCSDVYVYIKIQLDVHLQAALHIFLEVVKAETSILVLVFLFSGHEVPSLRNKASWAITFRVVGCVAGEAKKTLVVGITKSRVVVPLNGVCHLGLVVWWLWGLGRSWLVVRGLAFAFGLLALRGGGRRRQILVC
jgi:hypothetical protein